MGDVEVAALGGGGDEAMGASDSAAEATVADDGTVTALFSCVFFGVLCLLLSPVFPGLGHGDYAVIRLGYAMHARFQRLRSRVNAGELERFATGSGCCGAWDGAYGVPEASGTPLVAHGARVLLSGPCLRGLCIAGEVFGRVWGLSASPLSSSDADLFLTLLYGCYPDAFGAEAYK